MSRYGSFENMAAAMQQGIFHESDEVMSDTDETNDEISAQVVLQAISEKASASEEEPV